MTNSNDLVSSVTHLLTAAWAAYATLILLRLTRGHGPGRWAVGFFGLSMVLLWHWGSADLTVGYHRPRDR